MSDAGTTRHDRHDETLVLEATRDPARGAGLGMDVAQHATWSLRDAQEGADLAKAEHPPAFYTRWGNPSTRRLEDAVARLEGAEAALATGSGMGAIATAIFHYARKKKHVVAQSSLYSATAEMLSRLMTDYGVRTDFHPGPDTDGLTAKITKDTGFVYLESPSNPTMQITDIRAVADAAADKDVPVLIDNTFATPLNQRPLELGATVSMHSMTKYLGGHSDATGGVLAGSEKDVLACWETYKMLGPALAPYEAFLIHRGMKTLGLRMRQHNDNAMAVARFLEDHDKVAKVHYPGLPSHPGHEVAKRQMTGGFGGMLAFELEGGYKSGKKALESTELCVLGVSLGGVETLIQHPASMTHGPLSPEERKVAGIPEGLIRLSVGIEHPDDIIEDLAQAIEKAT